MGPLTWLRGRLRVRLVLLPGASLVQHRHAILSLVAPQPAPELLEKHERAFRRPQKEQRVDLWEIDALVELLPEKPGWLEQEEYEERTSVGSISNGSRGKAKKDCRENWRSPRSKLSAVSDSQSRDRQPLN